jgi:hypothetical protein
MFIQVLQGTVTDPEAIHARFTLWNDQLGPTAEGWLGATEGVTDDGEFIAVVRFLDEAAASRNSSRPEQGAWWSETESLFTGDVTFHDYPNVTTMLDGGSDEAGFVQILQGTYTGDENPAEMGMDERRLTELRPEILGATLGWNDTGHFTQTVYFTSLEAARDGEREMAADPGLSADMEEWLVDVDGLRYLDLEDPRMVTA